MPACRFRTPDRIRALKRLCDAVGQHGLRCNLARARSAVVWANRSVSGPSSSTAMPGLVQNCPAPIVRDPAQPAAISSPRAARGCGQEEHRVDRPQARRRNGTGSRTCQRPYRTSMRPARSDPVKPTARINGCLTSVSPNDMTAIKDLAEHAGVNPCHFDRGVKGLRDEIRNARMCGVAFNNDWAASSKCRRRVRHLRTKRRAGNSTPQKLQSDQVAAGSNASQGAA